MRLVIAGGAGFCGRLICRSLVSLDHHITVLSRSYDLARKAIPAVCQVEQWDGVNLGPWTRCLEGADALINLSGRSVNCRYNAQHCMEIYSSRLDSTRVLGEAIAACAQPPRVWINASSATIYKSAYDRPQDDATGQLGTGFSVDVCRRWEHELARAVTPRTRKVALRSSIVFAPLKGDDSPWYAFAQLARWGLLGTMAGGKQWVSWIHGDDFCRALSWLIEREDISGPINVAAPNPVPNREFLAEIRTALGVPFGLPSMPWMLALGAWLRGTETELILKSRRVVPSRLLESGFRFEHGEWPEAARSLAIAGLGR